MEQILNGCLFGIGIVIGALTADWAREEAKRRLWNWRRRRQGRIGD